MKMTFLNLLVVTTIIAFGAHGQSGLKSKFDGNQSRSLSPNDGAQAQGTAIKWQVLDQSTIDEKPISLLTCEACQTDPITNRPLLSEVKKLPAGYTAEKVSLRVLSERDLSDKEASIVGGLFANSRFETSFVVKKSAGDSYAIITIIPVRKVGAGWKLIERYELVVDQERVSTSFSRDGQRSNSWKPNSVLNSGDWYKIATGRDGIYKVTYQFLEECGLSVSGLPVDQLRLYGTGGGMVSMTNSDPRPDDLDQMNIRVFDGGDGSFDRGDYFLFYGEDQIVWSNTGQRYYHETNPFADSAYYFVTVSGGSDPVARIPITDLENYTKTVSEVDYYELFEEDLTNVIQSGRTWYGQELSIAPSLDYGLTVPNIVRGTNAYIRSSFIGRSVNISNTSMTMSLPNQGGESDQFAFGSVGSNYGAQFARTGALDLQVTASGGNFLTKMAFNNSANSQAQAWLDFIELNARRSLVFIAPSMQFSDYASAALGARVRFRVDAQKRDISIWDVSEPTNVSELQTSREGNYEYFVTDHDSLKTFIAFDESAFLVPSKVGAVANQNLHSLASIEYVVVTHPSFTSFAQQIADYHQQADGFSTAVVSVNEIYNEFSGGAQDITAIKEFMRMLYHEAENEGGLKPRYLLLFGDASYDYKDRISGNSNFIPAHQTKNSLVPTTSVVSDDYFGLMDDDEGEAPQDLIDIGIGRFPVSNKTEAQNVVNKIMYYVSNKTLGEWRNRVVFVADDEDGNTYMSQSNTLGRAIDTTTSVFNVDKVFLDAYRQVSGAGGERYPSVNTAINDRMNRGALIMYYIGHGGELGWAHERVLEVVDVNGWQNLDNMPLLVTATCEFSRFDDPRRTSAGEFSFLNPSGGAIGLLTTTRAVFSSPNFTLTQEFTRQAYGYLDDQRPRLGDISRMTKVLTVSTDTYAAANSRCFTLLGDPGLRLAYPEHNVVVSSIPDTMKALDRVTVTGYVADNFGNKLTDFNGLVYPLLFDKEARLKTLNNDGAGEFGFDLRKNALFRGKASVTNGDFSFEFIVPKDIDQNFGGGKLSFYAENGQEDGNGAFLDFEVGGVSDTPVDDSDGPLAELFLNNNKFVFGGLTDENPELYAEIWDENGINMVGNGIGHDITAVLDENTRQTIVLNDFYEADLDSYQSGKVRYPFNDLEDGRHTIKFQVWDVNNNPSDAFTEFIVADNEELALEHILNYPNPFTTNTSFFFEHNKPGQNLDVRIDVFTISGKLVKTIDSRMSSDGFRVGPIAWDGKDEYGDRIGRGVYIYRLSVKTPIGERANEFERLVILN